ncbi:hypothetical protein Ctha_1980 [Chloroherpeton thalassium ATCC 35110]|uniref:Uncharacterized protein n=1 Tax=Chloroherpeton thalassium (strain ATCC 35110 / GB-78) TaxID=517418 RepID=B3QUT3_CHLT3|nr:hypothetical protein [Chloroherpeton thalassium]ACF14434.1 hypothetical protein Ctha_1980 [Chloroherpeton thalassium ATCC 35110]
MDIALAKTKTNGGDEPDENGFTTIVTNGSPADPNGDAIKKNYELEFTDDNAFTFDGGGLIICFKSAGTYASDNTCTQVLMYGSSSDVSGYFVERFYSESDGNYPWGTTSTSHIGNFRLVTGTSNSGNEDQVTIPASDTNSHDFANAGAQVQFTTGNTNDLVIKIQKTDTIPSIVVPLPSSVENVSSRYWTVTVLFGTVDGTYDITLALPTQRTADRFMS